MLREKLPPALLRAWDMKIGSDSEEEENNLRKFLEFAQRQVNSLATPMEEDMKVSVIRTECRTSPRKSPHTKWIHFQTLMRSKWN
ncbi:hypothetical protein T07_1115 [Trichinella nelsoni]|uniref:Uncharacterized protein n=1 Tax=Trichinella nelsoni TaxID=6336 RepID=A0A0V0RS42_9BILA|nr:hypothetical protein T07_1115 [Trichinella nelsoni]